MQPQNKKTLILYTSIGLGHKSIAENIGFYLGQEGFMVEVHDAHKVQGGFLAKWGAKAHHVLINRLPFIWDWLYTTKWFISLTLPYRTKIAGRNYKNVLIVIDRFKPDIVISTHNTASAIVSYLKQQNLYKGLFGIAFSDYHLHRFWLFENADFYLANIESQKQEMQRLGITPDKIFVCGITLRPRPEISESDIRDRLDIPLNNKVILFSSGSQGVGLDKGLLSRLSKLERVSVLVACGKDEKLAQDLRNNFRGTNIIPLGYYTPMDNLYAISDIYISKPGGLSVAEALQWQLPVLIFYMLPGGEVFNYEYLVENNLVMAKTNDLLKSILKELESSEFKKSLAVNPHLLKLLGNGSRLTDAVKSL